VKEALHNIIKHAAATEVIMKIEFDKKLKIIIRDNGKGIDFDHVRRFGNGLVNIQERMKTIGGKANITNDKGAVIQLYVPMGLSQK
jgi:signal transduction histidine kinase